MAGFDKSRLEALAKVIWWNAGSTQLNNLENLLLEDGTIIPKLCWENVQNKDMWLRMAAAAAINIGVGVEEDLVKELDVQKLP
jgi:hypothetical protein